MEQAGDRFPGGSQPITTDMINWTDLLIAEAGVILMFALIALALWLIERPKNIRNRIERRKRKALKEIEKQIF